jgi:hypothetical protein
VSAARNISLKQALCRLREPALLKATASVKRQAAFGGFTHVEDVVAIVQCGHVRFPWSVCRSEPGIAMPSQRLRSIQQMASAVFVGALFVGCRDGAMLSAIRVKRSSPGGRGLDPAAFADHSLRSGFITSTAKAGASTFTMIEVCRHKSVETLRRTSVMMMHCMPARTKIQSSQGLPPHCHWQSNS